MADHHVVDDGDILVLRIGRNTGSLLFYPPRFQIRLIARGKRTRDVFAAGNLDAVFATRGEISLNQIVLPGHPESAGPRETLP